MKGLCIVTDVPSKGVTKAQVVCQIPRVMQTDELRFAAKLVQSQYLSQPLECILEIIRVAMVSRHLGKNHELHCVAYESSLHQLNFTSNLATTRAQNQF